MSVHAWHVVYMKFPFQFAKDSYLRISVWTTELWPFMSLFCRYRFLVLFEFLCWSHGTGYSTVPTDGESRWVRQKKFHMLSNKNIDIDIYQVHALLLFGPLLSGEISLFMWNVNLSDIAVSQSLNQQRSTKVWIWSQHEPLHIYSTVCVTVMHFHDIVDIDMCSTWAQAKHSQLWKLQFNIQKSTAGLIKNHMAQNWSYNEIETRCCWIVSFSRPHY